MSACPECGFELPAEGSCRVCATPRPAGKGDAPRGAGFVRFFLPAVFGLCCITLGLSLYFDLAPRSGAVDTTVVAEDPGAQPVAAQASGANGSGADVATPTAPQLVISPKILYSANFLPIDPRIPVREDPAAIPLAKHNPPLDSRQSFVAWMLAHTKEKEFQLVKKWDRSRVILARGEVRNKAVLEAFLYTPREYFARSFNAKKAYDDTAIPIGFGQTISGPHMVSHMTDSIAPLRTDRILEIGTGSGYQSAVLSELSKQVYTIEIVPALYAETDALYRRLEKSYPEYSKVTRKNADGYYGWPEHAPFDKIIVTAGIDHIPPPLLAQLAPGGIMVIPVGPPSGQTVLKVVKRPLPGGGFSFERSDIYHGRKVIFVPFTSDKGSAHSLDDAQGAQ